MTAQLSIENGEAYRLATELAAVTGESLDDVVTKALAERLARERSVKRPLTPERIAKRRAAAKHIRELGRRFREEGLTSNHDWLYDENGLPW